METTALKGSSIGVLLSSFLLLNNDLYEQQSNDCTNDIPCNIDISSVTSHASKPGFFVPFLLKQDDESKQTNNLWLADLPDSNKISWSELESKTKEISEIRKAVTVASTSLNISQRKTYRTLEKIQALILENPTGGFGKLKNLVNPIFLLKLEEHAKSIQNVWGEIYSTVKRRNLDSLVDGERSEICMVFVYIREVLVRLQTRMREVLKEMDCCNQTDQISSSLRIGIASDIEKHRELYSRFQSCLNRLNNKMEQLDNRLNKLKSVMKPEGVMQVLPEKAIIGLESEDRFELSCIRKLRSITAVQLRDYLSLMKELCGRPDFRTLLEDTNVSSIIDKGHPDLKEFLKTRNSLILAAREHQKLSTLFLDVAARIERRSPNRISKRVTKAVESCLKYNDHFLLNQEYSPLRQFLFDRPGIGNVTIQTKFVGQPQMTKTCFVTKKNLIDKVISDAETFVQQLDVMKPIVRRHEKEKTSKNYFSRFECFQPLKKETQQKMKRLLAILKAGDFEAFQRFFKLDSLEHVQRFANTIYNTKKNCSEYLFDNLKNDDGELLDFVTDELWLASVEADGLKEFYEGGKGEKFFSREERRNKALYSIEKLLEYCSGFEMIVETRKKLSAKIELDEEEAMQNLGIQRMSSKKKDKKRKIKKQIAAGKATAAGDYKKHFLERMQTFFYQRLHSHLASLEERFSQLSQLGFDKVEDVDGCYKTLLSTAMLILSDWKKVLIEINDIADPQLNPQEMKEMYSYDSQLEESLAALHNSVKSTGLINSNSYNLVNTLRGRISERAKVVERLFPCFTTKHDSLKLIEQNDPQAIKESIINSINLERTRQTKMNQHLKVFLNIFEQPATVDTKLKSVVSFLKKVAKDDDRLDALYLNVKAKLMGKELMEFFSYSVSKLKKNSSSLRANAEELRRILSDHYATVVGEVNLTKIVGESLYYDVRCNAKKRFDLITEFELAGEDLLNQTTATINQIPPTSSSLAERQLPVLLNLLMSIEEYLPKQLECLNTNNLAKFSLIQKLIEQRQNDSAAIVNSKDKRRPYRKEKEEGNLKKYRSEFKESRKTLKRGITAVSDARETMNRIKSILSTIKGTGVSAIQDCIRNACSKNDSVFFALMELSRSSTPGSGYCADKIQTISRQLATKINDRGDLYKDFIDAKALLQRRPKSIDELVGLQTKCTEEKLLLEKLLKLHKCNIDKFKEGLLETFLPILDEIRESGFAEKFGMYLKNETLPLRDHNFSLYEISKNNRSVHSNLMDMIAEDSGPRFYTNKELNKSLLEKGIEMRERVENEIQYLLTGNKVEKVVKRVKQPVVQQQQQIINPPPVRVISELVASRPKPVKLTDPDLQEFVECLRELQEHEKKTLDDLTIAVKCLQNSKFTGLLFSRSKAFEVFQAFLQRNFVTRAKDKLDLCIDRLSEGSKKRTFMEAKSKVLKAVENLKENDEVLKLFIPNIIDAALEAKDVCKATKDLVPLMTETIQARSNLCSQLEAEVNHIIH